jgi:hypothetical protein
LACSVRHDVRRIAPPPARAGQARAVEYIWDGQGSLPIRKGDSVLYPGPAVRNPLERLHGIQRRATGLEHNAPDDSLFTLFQMMSGRVKMA